ncbi:phage tail protein, partial [Salmonella enterica subsp. enterica serovar Mountpleasant]
MGEAAKRAVGTGANQIPDMSNFEFQNELNGGYVRFPQNWML